MNGVNTTDPEHPERRITVMRRRSPILGLASLFLLVSTASAGLDADNDAFDRLRDRPATIPTFAISPLDAADALWMETGTDLRLGLIGEHLASTDDRFRAGSRTTLGLATSAAPFGRPADLFGVSATLDDCRAWTPREARGPAGSPGVHAFYGWRLTPDLVLQPGLSWRSGDRNAPDRMTGLLGIRLEF
ncbi:MAG: hypothetical protein CMJ51_07160 [Planctomycetaceae bacterium]|nr:hypothetical protein [Planctomycetaceae bacterium]